MTVRGKALSDTFAEGAKYKGGRDAAMHQSGAKAAQRIIDSMADAMQNAPIKVRQEFADTVTELMKMKAYFAQLEDDFADARVAGEATLAAANEEKALQDKKDLEAALTAQFGTVNPAAADLIALANDLHEFHNGGADQYAKQFGYVDGLLDGNMRICELPGHIQSGDLAKVKQIVALNRRYVAPGSKDHLNVENTTSRHFGWHDFEIWRTLP